MSNRLEMPDELWRLIEKREQQDRRAAETPSDEGCENDEQTPIEAERRSGRERRSGE